MVAIIKIYQAENNTNTTACGGRITNQEVVLDGEGSGNLPALFEENRINAGVHRRKWGVKTLGVNGVGRTIIMPNKTPSNDTRYYLTRATQRDTVATMPARKYAAGKLNAPVADTDTVIIVDFEDGQAANTPVQEGDDFLIAEGATISTLLTVSAIAWTSNQAEITLSTAVGKNFTASAIAGSVIVDTENGNPRFDNVAKSFTGTTYDEINNPLILSRTSSIEETVTITVIDASSFSAISDKRGVLPNGSFSADYQPIADGYTEPSFILPASGWGGTPTANDTLAFQVHPAIVPFYISYEWQANAAAVADSAPFIILVDKN